MKPPFLRTTCLLSIALFGCNSSPPPPSSFTHVYEAIIAPTCANAYCHYAGIGLRQGSLDMNSQVTAYWNLVGQPCQGSVSYTHLRAHETDSYLVCRLLLEKKK